MSESLETLRDLLTRTEFVTGVTCGALALVALFAISRASRDRAVVGWGLAFAAALLVGVHRVAGQRSGLVAGAALMAMGGALVVRSIPVRVRWRLGWPLIIIGAFIIPWRGQVDEHQWFFVATPAAAIICGTGLAHWRTDEQRLLGPLLAITCFGVWTTVPDTELARLLLGVSLPLVFASMPPISARITSAGAYAVGGLFAWIPSLGGESRPASIIGAWASIGVITALPAACAVWHSRLVLSPWLLFGVHVLVVLVAARVIGLWTWAVPALLAAIVLYVGTMFALYEMDREVRTPGLSADSR